MTDFAGAGDWDLRAVVRGCNFSMDDVPHTCFSPLITHQEDDLVFGDFVFPEYLFDASTSNSDLDLEDLYKPFYRPISDQYSFSTQSTSSEKLLSDSPGEENLQPVGSAVADCSKAVATAVGAKYRRRKNQYKRVVMEVTEEGLSSDMWAWRKYGQKPIKGSPYPRSYYRCSSSRGCPARKQVERSHSDPATFIITYTAEHTHSKPTRRNSLAGTTRQRFSSNPAPKLPIDETGKDDADDKKRTKKKNDRRSDLTKTEMVAEEDKSINEEGVIISHDHHMMVMNDDFLVDFEEQLNTFTASPHLGFNQKHGSSSFW